MLVSSVVINKSAKKVQQTTNSSLPSKKPHQNKTKTPWAEEKEGYSQRTCPKFSFCKTAATQTSQS